MCGLVRNGVIKYLNYSFAVVILKCFKLMERFWILIDFKDTDVVLFGSVLQ